MDPDAAFNLMNDGSIEAWERVEAAQNLLGWLGQGGFPPAGHTAESADAAAHAVVMNGGEL